MVRVAIVQAGLGAGVAGGSTQALRVERHDAADDDLPPACLPGAPLHGVHDAEHRHLERAISSVSISRKGCLLV